MRFITMKTGFYFIGKVAEWRSFFSRINNKHQTVSELLKTRLH